MNNSLFPPSLVLLQHEHFVIEKNSFKGRKIPGIICAIHVNQEPNKLTDWYAYME